MTLAEAETSIKSHQRGAGESPSNRHTNFENFEVESSRYQLSKVVEYVTLKYIKLILYVHHTNCKLHGNHEFLGTTGKSYE